MEKIKARMWTNLSMLTRRRQIIGRRLLLKKALRSQSVTLNKNNKIK
jgi:hypothetical protein